MIRIRSAEYDSRNHRPPLRETSRRTPSANQRRTRWGSAAPLRDFFHELIFFLALHTTRLFKPRRATQSRHSERERGGWTTDRSRAGRATCDQCSKTSLSLSLTDSLCAWGYTTLQCLNREITILVLWLLWINMIRDEFIRCIGFSLEFVFCSVYVCWSLRDTKVSHRNGLKYTCDYLRKFVSRGVHFEICVIE